MELANILRIESQSRFHPLLQSFASRDGVLGLLAGDTDDAPHALGDTLLGDEHEVAGLGGVGQVGAATELDRKRAVISAVIDELVDRLANRHNADRVGINLAEYGPKSGNLLGLGERHFCGIHIPRVGNELAADGLHPGKVLGGDGPVVGKIKPELVLHDNRAPLLDRVTQDLMKRVVKHVGKRVIRSDMAPALVVNACSDGVSDVDRRVCGACHMQHEPGGTHDVQNIERDLTAIDGPSVRDLASCLGVERRLVQHQAQRLTRRDIFAAINKAVLGHDCAHRAFHITMIVLERIVRVTDPVARQPGGSLGLEFERGRRALLLGSSTDLLRLLKAGLEASHIHRHALFLGHKSGEIGRETKRIVEDKRILSTELLALGGLRKLLELRNALDEGLGEGIFLVSDDLTDVIFLFHELRVHVSEPLDNHVHEAGEESLRPVEGLPSVPDGTPQYTPQNVLSALVTWPGTVGNGEAEGADVVRDHPVRHVDVVRILITDLVAVRYLKLGGLLNRVKYRHEDIRGVVAPLLLEDAGHALESGARVNVLGRQLPEFATCLFVVLDEHNVPNLKHVGVVHVDQLRHTTAPDAVIVYLTARPTRTLVAHLPEIILGVKRQHAFLRQVLAPDVPGLKVRPQTKTLVPSKVRRVQSVLVHPVHLRQKPPCHSNCLLLEVVPKRPVAQHLEHGVMVRVLADIIQVVVLATCSDALLRVARPFEFGETTGGIRRPQEDGFVLVHTCVSKQQRRVVDGNDRAGRPVCVPLLLEIVDEGGPHLVARPRLGCGRSGRRSLRRHRSLLRRNLRGGAR
mmetsp:Transcript_1474/g.4793  ORF Transcript_1474/g.4793 Transcript_1474/m.4793 type:complete len:801 (-) Transcript_1474:135-2537(-)